MKDPFISELIARQKALGEIADWSQSKGLHALSNVIREAMREVDFVIEIRAKDFDRR